MANINPSLLKLIGDGFVDDAYAADGNHLRWMFDHRLGFPRFPFCLERRPGMGTEEALQGVELFFQNFTEPMGTVGQIVRAGLSVRRPGGQLHVTEDGIVVEERPMIIDFHGGSSTVPEPYACWVRLQFKVKVPGSKILADALYDNQGVDEVVDRVQLTFTKDFERIGLRPPDLKIVSGAMRRIQPVRALLRQPEVGQSPPAIQNLQERRLFRRLRQIDQVFYANVTQRYLQLLLEVLQEIGLNVEDLRPDRTISTVVTVELRAEQIDRVAVSGTGAFLQNISWVRTEELVNTDLWERVDCYPIATNEDDYFSRNEPHFDGMNGEELASVRLFEIMTNGAEPMDDPQAPPSRPPQGSEIQGRYFVPWVEQLEPWVQAILSESLSGDIHQSETTMQVKLTEAGQEPGAGVSPEVAAMADQTMTIRPYGMLLAASTAFSMARLLGLGAIDRPPEINEVPIWDYRLRGRWRVEDLESWGKALERQVQALLEQALAATPANQIEAIVAYLNAKFEVDTTWQVIQDLISTSVNGIFELWALKMGVSASKHALYQGPSSLSVTKDGLAMPGAGAFSLAAARLEWPLRKRARAIFDEEVPVGATIGRDPNGGGGVFPEVINPTDPSSEMPVAIVPTFDPDDPAAVDIATYYDRRVEDNRDYRYGVSECDPFGRWSAFRETTFRWDYDIPPAPPVQILAALEETGSPPRLKLTVSFSWARDLFDADDFSFQVHLERAAPPANDPNNRANWGEFSRLPSGTTGPFSFAGNLQTNAASHDSMPVTVAFTDTTRNVGGSVQQYRDYVLTFDGLEVVRDSIDRASVWVGVSSRDEVHGIDSAEVGGPAPAAHILDTPPPPPVWPPEPERATYADAEGLSSYTLSWNGEANVRYLVYRIGEQELINFLKDRGINTSAYDQAVGLNFKAAALKDLAVNDIVQDVFQLRSELVPEPPRYPDSHPDVYRRGRFMEPVDWPALPAGLRSFTDSLSGYNKSLTVYAILGKSRSGILSSWPSNASAFVVVTVPQKPEPARPQVLRAAWQPPLDTQVSPPQAGAARAELLIVQPPPESAPVTAYEVYRTLDPAKSGDYRLMRPLHRLEGPVFDVTLPGFENTAGVENRPVTRYIDPTVDLWKTYYYRVVARAPGENGGTVGMRSEASALAQVTTLSGSPPEAPENISVIRSAGPDRIEVSFNAAAPTTTAGDFQFDLIRLRDGSRIILTKSAAANARQGAGTDDYLLVVDGGEITMDDEMIIRVTDPLGQSTESDPFSERQPPDLVDLQVNRFFGFLNVVVRSAAPTSLAVDGPFTLELFTLIAPTAADPDPSPELRLSENLHDISGGGFAGWIRSGPDGDGRFRYRAFISAGGFDLDAVIVRLTHPNGLFTELVRDNF
jgi:hypothetical protein